MFAAMVSVRAFLLGVLLAMFSVCAMAAPLRATVRNDASAANQAALEARFIALYEKLMEKQVSFKEAVEPFKTDNQNAGKG